MNDKIKKQITKLLNHLCIKLFIGRICSIGLDWSD